MDMWRVETGDEETLPPWYDIPRLKHFQARQRLLLSVGPKGVQLMVRRGEGGVEVRIGARQNLTKMKRVSHVTWFDMSARYRTFHKFFTMLTQPNVL